MPRPMQESNGSLQLLRPLFTSLTEAYRNVATHLAGFTSNPHEPVPELLIECAQVCQATGFLAGQRFTEACVAIAADLRQQPSSEGFRLLAAGVNSIGVHVRGLADGTGSSYKALNATYRRLLSEWVAPDEATLEKDLMFMPMFRTIDIDEVWTAPAGSSEVSFVEYLNEHLIAAAEFDLEQLGRFFRSLEARNSNRAVKVYLDSVLCILEMDEIPEACLESIGINLQGLAQFGYDGLDVAHVSRLLFHIYKSDINTARARRLIQSVFHEQDSTVADAELAKKFATALDKVRDILKTSAGSQTTDRLGSAAKQLNAGAEKLGSPVVSQLSAALNSACQRDPGERAGAHNEAFWFDAALAIVIMRQAVDMAARGIGEDELMDITSDVERRLSDLSIPLTAPLTQPPMMEKQSRALAISALCKEALKEIAGIKELIEGAIQRLDNGQPSGDVAERCGHRLIDALEVIAGVLESIGSHKSAALARCALEQANAFSSWTSPAGLMLVTDVVSTLGLGFERLSGSFKSNLDDLIIHEISSISPEIAEPGFNDVADADHPEPTQTKDSTVTLSDIFHEEATAQIDDVIKRWHEFSSADDGWAALLVQLLHSLRGGARVAGLTQISSLAEQGEEALISWIEADPEKRVDPAIVHQGATYALPLLRALLHEEATGHRSQEGGTDLVSEIHKCFIGLITLQDDVEGDDIGLELTNETPAAALPVVDVAGDSDSDGFINESNDVNEGSGEFNDAQDEFIASTSAAHDPDDGHEIDSATHGEFDPSHAHECEGLLEPVPIPEVSVVEVDQNDSVDADVGDGYKNVIDGATDTEAEHEPAVEQLAAAASDAIELGANELPVESELEQVTTLLQEAPSEQEVVAAAHLFNIGDDESGPLAAESTSCVADLVHPMAEVESPTSVPSLDDDLFAEGGTTDEDVLFGEDPIEVTAGADLGENIDTLRTSINDAFANENDALDKLNDSSLVEVLSSEVDTLLPSMNTAVQAWVSGQAQPETIVDLRRTIHTLKGCVRIGGMLRVGSALHAMEDLLDSHDGTEDNLLGAADLAQAFQEALALCADTTLETLDRARMGMLSEPVASASSTTRGNAPASPEETMLAEGDTAPAAAAPAVEQEVTPPPSDPSSAPATSAQATLASIPVTQAAPAAPEMMMRVSVNAVESISRDSGQASALQARTEEEYAMAARSVTELHEHIDRARRMLKELEIQAEIRIQAGRSAEGGGAFDPIEFDRFTQLQEVTRSLAESINDISACGKDLSRQVERLMETDALRSGVNQRIQEHASKLLLSSLAAYRARLERVIALACSDTGKKATLLLADDAQAPGPVLDRLLPSIEHILRNSIAHGIETPAVRMAKNKPISGTVSISVQHTGARVSFIVSDDGAGIDTQKVLERAVSKGLAREDRAMSDQQIFGLLFKPGFSTADSVSQLAGRGVGLDVVQHTVTEVGGSVSISSAQGHGTSFTLSVPSDISNMAVVPVAVGGANFLIPANLVDRLLSLHGAAGEEATSITLEGHEAPCPVIDLARMVGVSRAKGSTSKTIGQAGTILVIMGSNSGSPIAFKVDQVRPQVRILAQPLSPLISSLPGIVAGTIDGAGAATLVINPTRMNDLGADAVEAVPSATLVMLVDDSSTVRMTTSQALRRDGFEVITAKDGLDAVEQLQRGVHPDAFIFDLEMPRMDGFELTKTVRAMPMFEHTPIFVVSSRTSAKHKEKVLGLGATEFLGKPVQTAELSSLIHSLKLRTTANDNTN